MEKQQLGMDAEFWTVVINGSSNLVIAAAMVIQTILFFVTFRFGFRYLEQHKEKISEENRQKLIVDSVRLLIQMDADSYRYFNNHIKYEMDDSDERAVIEYVSTFIQLLRTNQDFSTRIDNFFYNLEANIRILKNPKISKKLQELTGVRDSIDQKYSQIKMLAEDNSFHRAYLLAKSAEPSASKNQYPKLAKESKALQNLLVEFYYLESD